MTDKPRKNWRYRGVGRFVVGQWQGNVFDIYRGANTIEGAKKAKREVPHWTRALIYDQVTETYI